MCNTAALPLLGVGDLLTEGMEPHVSDHPPSMVPDRTGLRVGIIANPRSRRNRNVSFAHKHGAEVLTHAPVSQQALGETLRELAARQIRLLVIDGGDGTVRDVLSAAPGAFGDALPPIAVIPSGKTNALAIDLGIPADWTSQVARHAFDAGRIVTRQPLEIEHEDGTILRGFIFGAGGFRRATELAQRTHAIGAFGGLAVALSICGAIGQTVFGRAGNPWRAGERMEMMDLQDQTSKEGDVYLLLGSTLRRLPLRIRPLGNAVQGLNILAVQAPPRLLPLAAPAILAGYEGGWLKRAGYHHLHDLAAFRLRLGGGFILDGEAFAAEAVTIRAGAPIRFVTA